ncbi:MAG: sulfite exporter TauE/SafE family protein [Mycobacteriales bacterium]
MDPTIGVAGFMVGVLVGLTGMGGGALMTPVLVLVFGVQPLAAVSSDLVASLFMKPVGGLVHLRHGTVHFTLVKWLCLGSVPAAFAGVLVLRALGSGETIQDVVKVALGVALLLAVLTMVARALLVLRQHGRSWRAGSGPSKDSEPIVVRVWQTVLVGAVGGVVVGMTSVGSGSLIIVMLLLLYPKLRAAELVGTDLVQAVPLVAAAALGHALFGEVQLGLTAGLLAGALPGVWLGARLSSRAPQRVVRRALALVLLASGLKLVGASTEVLGAALLAVAVLGPLAWMAARRLAGLPASWRAERREVAARSGPTAFEARPSSDRSSVAGIGPPAWPGR